MTGNARNMRRWPRSTQLYRPITIFNPQGNISVLTTAAVHSAAVHSRPTFVNSVTTVGVSEVAQTLHALSTAVSIDIAAHTQAVTLHNVLLDSLTTVGAYSSLTLPPNDSHLVRVLTTGGVDVFSPTLRASTPNVLTNVGVSLLAVILPRDIDTSVSTTAGVSFVAGISRSTSIEALATFGASVSAFTAGSTPVSISTDVGVGVAAQSLKRSLIAVLNTAGISLETQAEKNSFTASDVTVAVIPMTFSGHNAPITISIVSTVGVSTGAEVEHNTVPLASVVTIGADAPAITTPESFIEILTTAGIDTATALHLARNPILVLRTSVGGTSMVQLGAEKMVEIQETQPGVTADV